MPYPSLAASREFADLLDASFARMVGRPLIPPDVTHDGRAFWLYEAAPFSVLAHDTADDPVFVYGNRIAQRCFEYDWHELTQLPSRLSAELPDREERERLLAIVKRQGFISDYRGVRIARSGRRFIIENAIVWELVDETGRRHGQAATFASWRDV